MPIQNCQKDGKPGFKWGPEGFCYIFEQGNKESIERARKKALEQGRAIEASKEENK
jgi:hypothetical protein